MAKYRKKPVVIEAFRWTGGEDQTEDPEWIVGAMLHGDAGIGRDGKSLWIRTLEGTMTAFVGDWIIRGIKGEIYPCKSDIFEATYELVHATEPKEEPHWRCVHCGQKSPGHEIELAAITCKCGTGMGRWEACSITEPKEA